MLEASDESADDEFSLDASDVLLDSAAELVSASLELDLPQLVNIHTLKVSAISAAEIFFIISFFLSLLGLVK